MVKKRGKKFKKPQKAEKYKNIKIQMKTIGKK
jgi:hypothetical protein